MKTNPVAKMLQIIGWVGIIATVALLFISSSKQDSVVSDYTIIISILLSFIICMIFQGFAEIIELLYINKKEQKTIIDFIFLNNKKQEEILKAINSANMSDANSDNTTASDFDFTIQKNES